jgi:N-methylhydantoinase B/oxoprolinase/acetone carboxylase alpha subunit
MRSILQSGRYPVRNVEQNLADLRAQVAACAKGAAELAKMVAHFGLPVVRAYMRHVRDNAEESVRRVVGALADGRYAYEMDSGAVIRVAISVDRGSRSATIDFTGTSAQQPTNFNAPSAVFPVRLEAFAVRRGSGGAGRHRGGDGAIRRVRFLEPMTAVMLANHRRIAPFGVAGGAPGALGRNWVERVDGSREDYGATFQVEMNTEDVLVVETPGGGGFGEAA